MRIVFFPSAPLHVLCEGHAAGDNRWKDWQGFRCIIWVILGTTKAVAFLMYKSIPKMCFPISLNFLRGNHVIFPRQFDSKNNMKPTVTWPIKQLRRQVPLRLFSTSSEHSWEIWPWQYPRCSRLTAHHSWACPLSNWFHQIYENDRVECKPSR